MTDAECRWEPVPGAWNVRPRGTGTAPIAVGAGEFTIDFALPQPDPPPVMTIAWRLGHIIVGVWKYDGHRDEHCDGLCDGLRDGHRDGGGA